MTASEHVHEGSAGAPRSVRDASWRFVLVGGVNTLVTGALQSLLSLVIQPQLAYTIVFAVGIVFSTVMAGRFVNGVRLTRTQNTMYVAMYVAVYLLGVGLVSLGLGLGLPRGLTGLVVLVTAPLTFLGGRMIVAHGRPAGVQDLRGPAQ